FSANPTEGCTIVMVAKGNIVLAGNNEDWRNPKTKIWFVPASNGEYGRVCVGFDNMFVQGGMNDQGLFIDANALSPTGWEPMEGKPTFPGDLDTILAKCATVEEAIAFCDKYNFPGLARARFPIADRTGASVVIEYGQGKVQYVRKTGVYQIATNFVISNVKGGRIFCTRYRVADKMLKNAEDVSLDLVRAVLSATHQEGQYPTVYSNICDLRKGILYLYNFHNFEEVIQFNLEEELKKGRKVYDIPSLFLIKTHVAHVFDGQRTIPASKELLRVINRSGVEKAIERYHRMKNQFRKIYRYNVSKQEINALGYMLLRDDKTEEAIATFELNVSEHPKSWNVYDSLGEAYMKHGEEELAIENYQKSLEMNPDNVNGKDMLEKLGVKK
ncbi:MAG: tetratricopeptide repeat protein, partial [Candidatus Thorarchaeota archaeon]